MELSLIQEASAFLNLMYNEQNLSSQDLEKRLAEIRLEYQNTGTYRQNELELSYGTKVAWRNSVNCIGRIFWRTLNFRDLRHLTTAEEIFNSIIDHIKFATNGGNIQPTISVFAPQKPGQPGIRIWNPQFIRYAGYRQSDGSVIGDPERVELTKICQNLGWKGEGTQFDILPLIIQMPEQAPEWFEIPKQVVMEVPITHPEYAWFADLKLKWHALPAVADWRLEIGGISYTAAPFNGWYMSAEIGARNFGDSHRYNLLPIVAKLMGLNTRSKLSLWQDHALIELNKAVLYSFIKHNVSIVDHHTASTQFIQHMKIEKELNRIVPSDWSRIVPPLSASTTKVFHQSMENLCLKPNFFPQSQPWVQSKCPFHESGA